MKYIKEKIVIMGHSFGSILGSIYATQHPGDVLYYIGAGQVVSIFENEQAGYKKLQELIIASGNKKDLSKLKKIGTYPENSYNKSMIKKFKRCECFKVNTA